MRSAALVKILPRSGMVWKRAKKNAGAIGTLLKIFFRFTMP